MKKILIIAYDFPPYNSIGGQRPYGWSKYFFNAGLYPVIVTRHWDENILNEADCLRPSSEQLPTIDERETATVIRVPFNPNFRDKLILKYGINKFRLFRKIWTLFYSILRFCSHRIDNTSGIFYRADDYLAKNKCDYILATGEPFILFRYAGLLSKKYKIKWFADYRDGWSTNLMVSSVFSYRISPYRFFCKVFEKKYSSTAECIFTVSDFAKNKISGLFPGKNINIIRNGYFEEDYQDIIGIQQSQDKFTISYIGSIYPYQPVELFLEGFYDFIQKNNIENIIINFYGIKFYEEQEKRLLGYIPSLDRFILTTERIPKSSLFRELKKTHLLLLLASDVVDSSCAKVFEYLPLNRKILLIKNDNGILEGIINDCDAGYKCSSKDEIISALQHSYREFLDTGKVSQETRNYEYYNRKVQSEAMAKIILNY